MTTATRPNTRRYRPLRTRADIPTDVEWLFRDHLHRRDGHRIWTGATDTSGTPVIGHDYAKFSVLRISWLLHRGTEPAGTVLSACGVRGCVNGACLTDAGDRRRERIMHAALLGIDMTGTCSAGHPHADYGRPRTNGRVECTACDNARRRETRAARKAVA
ncbi:hypothetical protein [Kitasatospora sp. NPDC090091]|uniref:hypothetical protein n=1 Tax=Kitasatospora sp. NPDC090091 TaxID=3364081 RepID=UPI0038164E92